MATAQVQTLPQPLKERGVKGLFRKAQRALSRDISSSTGKRLSWRIIVRPSSQQVIIGQDPKGRRDSGVDLPSATTSKATSEKNSIVISSPVSTAPRSIPEIQTALLVIEPSVKGASQYQLVDTFPVPQQLAPNEVMIRTHAVGLNHIDWKSVDYNFCLPERPWITGREMAGVVERVGSAVGEGIRVGDKVWTSTYYKERRAGCFQEFVTVPQHTVCHIHETMGFVEASTLGVAGLTAGMSLWRWLDVPMDHNVPETDAPCILIWGGSTITGQFAIQICAQAGLDVIAVCSTLTADLVRGLGAKHVVVYSGKSDSEVVEEIRTLATGRRLSKAIDLVGAKTAKLVLEAVTSTEETDLKVDFAPLAFMSSKQEIPSNVRVHNVEMKQFVLDPESEKYARRLNELVGSGAVRIPKIKVLDGGLARVEEGLNRLKEGNLGGEKLVVSLSA